jgi:hypothetical protein
MKEHVSLSTEIHAQENYFASLKMMDKIKLFRHEG